MPPVIQGASQRNPFVIFVEAHALKTNLFVEIKQATALQRQGVMAGSGGPHAHNFKFELVEPCNLNFK